jgi:hypothetical protein
VQTDLQSFLTHVQLCIFHAVFTLCWSVFCSRSISYSAFDCRLLYLPMTPQARVALERLTADLRDERAAHAAETTARAAAEAEVEKRKAALKVRCAAVKTFRLAKLESK